MCQSSRRLPILQALHFTSQLQHPIKWWRYSHESRLVLLGTGELGLWLQVSPELPRSTPCHDAVRAK